MADGSDSAHPSGSVRPSARTSCSFMWPTERRKFNDCFQYQAGPGALLPWLRRQARGPGSVLDGMFRCLSEVVQEEVWVWMLTENPSAHWCYWKDGHTLMLEQILDGGRRRSEWNPVRSGRRLAHGLLTVFSRRTSNDKQHQSSCGWMELLHQLWSSSR